MNHCVHDWSMEDDSRSFHDLLPSANYRKSTWPENELVELLWQNGHVVMHSQTNRKTMVPPNETKQCQKPESASRSGEPLRNSANLVQEETSSWLQYAIDDPLEKEFCWDFFYGQQTTEPSAIDKLKDVISEEDKYAERGAPEENNILSKSVFEQSDILPFGENMMPAASEVVASFPQSTSAENGGFKKIAHFSRPLRPDSGPLNRHCGEKSLGNQIQGENWELSSMTTKESSICGSNQVQKRFDVSCSNTVTVVPAQVTKEDAQTQFSHERVHTDMHETTVTSSSGGSGCTVGRKGEQSARTRIHKRKGREADESDFLSEEAEYESIQTNKKAQKSSSARRRRAAEVHNLSERRRRDRINEKMRALQQLIPHCNKSDKASMLDDAIEYLKSLQLQVQVMWMGSGMAPMMFPGVHHYMPQIMSMGLGSMPSMHGPIPFPSVPIIKQSLSSSPAVKQAASCHPSGISPVNFQNQMQMPSSYANCLGFHHMQPSPQMTNLFAYGSQLMQQTQTALAARSFAPCNGGSPSENTRNGSAG